MLRKITKIGNINISNSYVTHRVIEDFYSYSQLP